MDIELLKPDEEDFFILLGEAAEQVPAPWTKFSTIAEKLKIDKQRVQNIASNFWAGGKYYDSARNMPQVIPRPSCIELARKIQAKRNRKPDYDKKANTTIRSKWWIVVLILAGIFIAWLLDVIDKIFSIFHAISS